MIRRDFLATTAAGLGASVAATSFATLSPRSFASARITPRKFKLAYAPHFGMFANHAKDDLDQISFAADQGFNAWEDNGMKGRGKDFQDKFAARCEKHGVRMGIFVSTWIDWEKPTLTTGDAAMADRFVKEVGEAVEVAKRVNATWMTTVVGRVDQSRPWGHQFSSVLDTLKRAAAMCEKAGKVMVIEPLNWRDHPGQFCPTSDVLRAICKGVSSPGLKVLQDLYHLQVTEGNLIDNMDRSWEEIVYFQTGDNPGRCEPGTGEVNYRNVFKHIQERGFKGILGMEHGKSKDGKEGELAVIEAYAAADGD